MFEKVISELSKAFGIGEINFALIVGAFFGFLLRSIFGAKKKSGVVVSSPLAQAMGAGNQPSVSFNPLTTSPSSPDADGGQSNSFASNHVQVKIQGKEFSIDGSKMMEQIQKGDIIAAIKTLRTETGLGLKESKDVVDALVKTAQFRK